MQTNQFSTKFLFCFCDYLLFLQFLIFNKNTILSLKFEKTDIPENNTNVKIIVQILENDQCAHG